MGSLTLALAVSLSMLTSSLAAQIPPSFQLLSFACVAIDRNQSAFLQFEREVFPTFTDTGLFKPAGQELLYVEQGWLTIVSDQKGNVGATQGYSFLAEPGSVLGVRNDDTAEGAVLWLRFSTPSNRTQSAFAAPDAIRAVLAPPRVMQLQPLQPFFVDFEAEENIDGNTVYLFMARMRFEPSAGIDPFHPFFAGQELTTSGTIAVFVDAGALTFDDGPDDGSVELNALLSGQFQVVDGANQFALLTGGGPGADAFVAGMVAVDDKGQVGSAIAQSPVQGQSCPAS